jgi:hypothetical protein
MGQSKSVQVNNWCLIYYIQFRTIEYRYNPPWDGTSLAIHRDHIGES